MNAYADPVLNADWSDPDVVRVGDDTPWRWTGALLGLFAVAPEGPGHAGVAIFTRFRITSL